MEEYRRQPDQRKRKRAGRPAPRRTSAGHSSAERRLRRPAKRSLNPQKRRILGLICLAAAAAAVILVCVFLFAPAFDIDNIVCEGNSKTSSETIVQASGIQRGHNIFLTPLSGGKKPVEELDYIESCEISRELPNTIKITVVEHHPSAYFNTGGALAVTDMGGSVLELVNGDDAEDIINSKITEKEPEPSGSPDPDSENEEDSDEPDPESTADGTIWGYDDDGDPIYRVNGGHYEFDEDGNRFFVDDTPEESPEPTADAESGENVDDGDGIAHTRGGRVIYDAPVVYGVQLSKYDVGKRIESADGEKLNSVLDALKALDSAGLLERTTKFDAENVNDVKFVIEDRLEVWFGGFEDFEYKAKFTATVVNENLSPYERGIVDFRDSKLYVRPEGYQTPMLLDEKETPAPDSDEEEAEEDPDATKRPKSTADPDDEDEDEDEDDTRATQKPKAASKPTAKPTSRPADEDEEDADLEE